MKKKPIVFNLLSMVYFLIAISIPIQIIVLYGHSFKDLELIQSKISIFNWLVMGLCTYSSYCLYHAKEEIKYLIPISLTIITINNWLVSYVGMDYTNQQTGLASILITVISSTLIFSRARKVILNQGLRWWKWADRKKKMIPVTIMLKNKELYKTNTFDLSRTGAYLNYSTEESSMNNTVTTKILRGETVEIVIGDPKSRDVMVCKAKVIRKSNQKGSYPKGIGINFENLTMKKSMTLMKILHDQTTSLHT